MRYNTIPENMNSKLSTLLSLFLLVSCTKQQQTPTPLTQSQKTALTQEITQTLNNYYSDIKQHGLTAEFAYLDSSEDFFWVPPGYSVALSYDSVAAVLKQNAPKFKSIENSFDTLRINIISNELATYTGRLHSTMIDTLGKSSTFSLVETGVMIKRKNGWKLLSGQTALLP